jgi:hypothetical protein
MSLAVIISANMKASSPKLDAFLIATEIIPENWLGELVTGLRIYVLLNERTYPGQVIAALSRTCH